MRYIDADVLIDDLIHNRAFYPAMVASAIKNTPTADVVEVVRCKDCKHNVANWEHDELDIGDYTDITCDYFMTDGMQPDDFCCRGERREQKKNEDNQKA